MITGTVSGQWEGVIRISLLGVQGQFLEIDAIVDTGFSRFLTLPAALISSLGLPLLGQMQGQLADGQLQMFDVYSAILLWDGQPRQVDVEASENEPLVGMRLLAGYELLMQVIPGGAVTLQALP